MIHNVFWMISLTKFVSCRLHSIFALMTSLLWTDCNFFSSIFLLPQINYLYKSTRLEEIWIPWISLLPLCFYSSFKISSQNILNIWFPDFYGQLVIGFYFLMYFLLLQSTYYMSKKSRSFSFPILNGSCLVGHTILVQVDEFGGGLKLMDPPISSVVLLSFLNLFQIYFQHLIHWLLFYGQFVMIFSFLIFFFYFFLLTCTSPQVWRWSVSHRWPRCDPPQEPHFDSPLNNFLDSRKCCRCLPCNIVAIGHGLMYKSWPLV